MLLSISIDMVYSEPGVQLEFADHLSLQITSCWHWQLLCQYSKNRQVQQHSSLESIWTSICRSSPCGQQFAWSIYGVQVASGVLLGSKFESIWSASSTRSSFGEQFGIDLESKLHKESIWTVVWFPIWSSLDSISSPSSSRSSFGQKFGVHLESKLYQESSWTAVWSPFGIV